MRVEPRPPPPRSRPLRARRAGLFVALLAALSGPGAATPDEPAAPAWEPYVGTLPGLETDRACFLVRDARTGEPLRFWAEVQNCLDWTGPEGWGATVQSGTADEFGLVRMLPGEAGIPHWLIRAPGMEPQSSYGEGARQDVVDLEPAPEQHGRIVDVRGRPVAGALVETLLDSWRHGPRLRTTYTDSDGLWRLRVSARAAVTLVDGPGVRQEYGIPLAPTWAAPPTFVAEPGRDLRIRVLGRRDAIGGQRLLIACDTVRGPHALVERDGTCLLKGVEPDCGTVYVHGYQPPASGTLDWLGDGSPELDPQDWTPGRELRWIPDLDPEARGPRRPVLLALVAPSGLGEGWFPTLDRLEDGRRFEAWHELVTDPTIAHDVARTTEPGARWAWSLAPRLEPGTYAVAAGSPFDALRARAGLVRVPPPDVPGLPTLPIVLERQPKLHVELQGGRPQRLWVFARAADGDLAQALDPDELQDADAMPHVPATGEVGVTALGSFGLATALAGPVQDGVRSVRLTLPEPAVLSLPGEDWTVGPDASSSEEVMSAGGRSEIRLPPGGRTWVVPPDDDEGLGFHERRDLRGLAVEVPSAPGGRRTLEPGDLRGPPVRRLKITLPEGLALPEPIVAIWTPSLLRPDLPHPAWVHERAEPDEQGRLTVLSRALRDGSLVTLELESAPSVRPADPHASRSEDPLASRDERWLPARLTCTGDGPYELRVPRGELAIELGAPPDARLACLLDGDLLNLGAAAAGHTLQRRIRGVAAGPHVLVVAAQGCESQLTRFTLAEGEAKRLALDLKPRRSP